MKRARSWIAPVLGFILIMCTTQVAIGAEPEIAAGPRWWPGAGSVNFETAEAACNSTQFQNAYLGSSNFMFHHVGPRNESDKRNWCWFAILDNDTTPRYITVVSPACPAGSQLSITTKSGNDQYRCICNAGLSYDTEARQCLKPKTIRAKSKKK